MSNKLKIINSLRIIVGWLFISNIAVANQWADGSNAIAKDYADGRNSTYTLSLPFGPITWEPLLPIPKPEWVNPLNIEYEKVTLLSVDTFGGWDIGYSYDFSYSFGEGIDVLDDGYSKPQLMTRTDLALSAAAWLKLTSPGAELTIKNPLPLSDDFVYRFDILKELTGIDANIDERIEIPEIDYRMPFLGDDTPLFTAGFQQGIYDEDYTNTTFIDLGKNIPGVDLQLGIARGLRGDLTFGLERIDYYESQAILAGSQLSAERGVLLETRRGETIHIDKRNYVFRVEPTIEAGSALAVNAVIIGTVLAEVYYPEQGAEPAHLISGEYSRALDVTVPLDFDASYSVPALPKIDVAPDSQGNNTPNKASLVAYYSFDGTVNDVFSTSNHLFEVPNSCISYDVGVANNGATFDGEACKAVVPEGVLNTEGSVSIWVKPNALSVQGTLGREPAAYIFSHLIPNAEESSRTYIGHADGGELFFGAADQTVLNTGLHLRAGRWTHVSLTWSDTRMVAYINGEKVIDRAKAPTTQLTQAYIGGYIDARESVFFDGLIDELRFYHGVLSPDEVRFLYQTNGGSTLTSEINTLPLVDDAPQNNVETETVNLSITKSIGLELKLELTLENSSNVLTATCAQEKQICSYNVPKKSNLVATSTASAQSIKWGGNCSEESVSNCSVILSTDKIIIAVLVDASGSNQGEPELIETDSAIKIYRVSLSKNLGGTIVSSPLGINCDANDTTCDGVFTEGTEILLTATANRGYAVSAWPAPCASTANQCRFIVSGNTHIQISFIDTFGPVVTAPADISIVATGVETGVDLGTASAVDSVDGVLEARPSHTGPFRVGTHQINWHATDSQGNRGQAAQFVEIKPALEIDDTVNLAPIMLAVSDVGIHNNEQVEINLAKFLSDESPATADYRVVNFSQLPEGIAAKIGSDVNPNNFASRASTILTLSANPQYTGGAAILIQGRDDIGKLSNIVSFKLIVAASANDADADGVLDNDDNCPFDANPDQKDWFNDGIGDVCDPDHDDDGVPNDQDISPYSPSEGLDNDGDGVGDVGDLDDDNDLIPDEWELANGLDPLNKNDAQLDNDGDGLNNYAEYLRGTNPNDVTGLYVKVSKPDNAIIVSSPEGIRCGKEENNCSATFPFASTVNLAIDLDEGYTLSQWGGDCRSFNGTSCKLYITSGKTVSTRVSRQAQISGRYVINLEGIVEDTITGLHWQRCSEGLDGEACEAGSIVRLNLSEALLAANLSRHLGHTNWRLPTKNELQGIVDFSRVNPAIESVSFPNTQSDFYWAIDENTSEPYLVDFSDGRSYQLGSEVPAYVRLVRDTESVSEAASTKINLGAVILDTETQLMWYRCPMLYEGVNCETSFGTSKDDQTSQVQKADRAVFKGIGDWRLPTIEELVSLLEDNSQISTDLFPREAGLSFWSNTEHANVSGNVWLLNADTGEVSAVNRGDSHQVLLVRSNVSYVDRIDNGDQTFTSQATGITYARCPYQNQSINPTGYCNEELTEDSDVAGLRSKINVGRYLGYGDWRTEHENIFSNGGYLFAKRGSDRSFQLCVTTCLSMKTFTLSGVLTTEGGHVVLLNTEQKISNIVSNGVFVSPQMHLRAVAHEGYEFIGWKGDCAEELSDICMLPNTQSYSVQPLFKVLPEVDASKIVVGIIGFGSANLYVNGVKTSWDSTSETTLEVTLKHQSNIRITPSMNTGGYFFKAWLAGCANPESPYCDFTLSGDTTITAQYSSAITTPEWMTYKMLGDHSVLDKESGIIWKRCPEQTVGDNCEGTYSQARVSYATALSFEDEIWRLPTISELGSFRRIYVLSKQLFERDAVFPNRNVSLTTSYWTSSVYQKDSNFIYASQAYSRSGSRMVRLVRRDSKPLTRNFVDNVDGTISDTDNGLMWAKCSEGLYGETCENGALLQVENRAIADVIAKRSTLAGLNGWRVPSITDIYNLIDYQRYAPAVDTQFFPGEFGATYWADTPVNLYSGGHEYGSKIAHGQPDPGVERKLSYIYQQFPYALRLVRDIPKVSPVSTTDIELSLSILGQEGAIHYAAGKQTCTTACQSVQLQSGEHSFTAVASTGYYFVEWGGACDGSIGITCNIEVQENTDITATFAQNIKQLTVLKNNFATITTTGGHPINCGLNGDVCEAVVVDANELVLTAEVASGYILSSWQGCTSSMANTCTWQANTNTTISATVVVIPPDSDDDGIFNTTDNCPNDANTDQADFDADAIGDICDPDDDNDGTNDNVDKFPKDAAEATDFDNDGVGDNADTDDDNDGLPDTWEIANDLDPFEAADATSDNDNDNVTALDEFKNGTDPNVLDLQLIEQYVTVVGNPVAVKGNALQFAISYTVADENDALSGLGLRVHFNSEHLAWSSFSKVLSTSLIAKGSSVMLDTADFDNNPATNHYVTLAWAALNSDWPSEIPVILAHIHFIVKDTASMVTPIGFSASSAPKGYTLADVSYVVPITDASFDIDQNGQSDALTDGLLFLRYAFGFRGDTLMSGVVANDAGIVSNTNIESALATVANSIGDIDGNGQTDALTDGLLLLRYQFGFRGATLIAGVVAGNAARTTASEIEAYLAQYSR